MPPLMAAGLPLLANAESDLWTNKEVLIAIGKVIALVVGVMVTLLPFIVRHFTKLHRERAEKWEQDFNNLSATHDDLKTRTANVIADLQDRNDTLAQELRDANDDLTDEKLKSEGLGQRCDDSELKIAELEGNLEGSAVVQAALEKVIDKASKQDGYYWNRRVYSSAREYEPLDPAGRDCPVISFLNLKGGVGKTTVASNLASAFAHLGYQILLIDLDLQGSLSARFFSIGQIEGLHESKKTVGDFLNASFDKEAPNIQDFATPVDSDGRLMLVPTHDKLAYAEMNMSVRWMLSDKRRDPRFLLRRELYLRRNSRKFDLVLLDCPPIINMSCLNALVASDYLVIPVTPSEQATSRIPSLLHTVRGINFEMRHQLRVMGIVANRTSGAKLSAVEENLLSGLSNRAKDVVGYSVPVFDTVIRQSVDVREAESEHRSLRPEDSLFGPFSNLAKEIEGYLPAFCLPKPSSRKAEGVKA